METGVLSGLLLAVVNGAICLSLPLVLAATQNKRKPIEDSTLPAPQLISQEVQ